MKSFAVFGIVLVAAKQVTALGVLGTRPYLGHGPVIQTTDEAENDPVWNSAGVDKSTKIKLKVTHDVAETSTPSYEEMGQMGPMGRKSYQCGLGEWS